MPKLGFETAYQSVLAYAPPKVRELLTREIPNIEQAIDREVDKFGVELGQYIAAEVGKLQTELIDSQAIMRGKIAAANDKLEQLRGKKVEEAREAIDELKRTLDEYEKKWTGLGDRLGNTVLGAVKGAGVPIPGA